MNEKQQLLLELHNSLNYYSQFTNMFDDLRESRENLESFTSNPFNRVVSHKTITYMVILIAIAFPIIGCVLSLMLTICFNSSFDLVKPFIALGALCTLPITLIIYSRLKKKRSNNYTKVTSELNSRIEYANDFIVTRYTEFFDSGFQVLPIIYCEPCIIERLIYYIENCRADTLKEAINCLIYDDNISTIQQNQLISISALQEIAIETRRVANLNL